MIKRCKKGQSTLEYVIILTAIIAGILVVASGAVKPKVQSSMNGTMDKMNTMVGTINFTSPDE